MVEIISRHYFMWIHFLPQNNPLCHSPWTLGPPSVSTSHQSPLKPSSRWYPVTRMSLPWLPGWKTPTPPLIIWPDVSCSLKLPQNLQQLLLMLLSWITLCSCEGLLLLNWALQLQIQYLFPFKRKGLWGRRVFWIRKERRSDLLSSSAPPSP